MDKYLRLFRLGNALMGIVGVLVATFLAAGFDVGDHMVDMLICSATVFAFICGGNALNDYIDHEIDRTAHPERPIPSGEMTRKQALNAGAFMMALAAALSVFTMDAACVAIVIVAAVLMVSYETVLKQRGFAGNVTIAVLTGMMFLLGGAVVGDVGANAAVAAMAALVSVGREVAKDIEDMDSDEGRSTLPMRIGTRLAAAVSSAFFVSGPALSIAPMVWGTYGALYYTVLVPDAMFLFCAFKVFSDPHSSQKIAKMGMMAALASFILGVLPV